MNLTLPWPPSGLSPNARLHWRRKAEMTAKLRRDTWLSALAQGVRRRDAGGPVTMTVTFCPPDNRRRDFDNAFASAKALFDGLSDALGVDDRLFVMSLGRGFAEPVKGGAVLVEIAP